MAIVAAKPSGSPLVYGAGAPLAYSGLGYNAYSSPLAYSGLGYNNLGYNSLGYNTPLAYSSPSAYSGYSGYAGSPLAYSSAVHTPYACKIV